MSHTKQLDYYSYVDIIKQSHDSYNDQEGFICIFNHSLEYKNYDIVIVSNLYFSEFSTLSPISLMASEKLSFIFILFTITYHFVIIINPTIIRIVVVFPAPFGPSKPKISPFLPEKDRSSTTFLPPRFLVNSFNSKTVSVIISTSSRIF